MYDQFYNFTGKPFQLNPDPTFFFQSKGHQRAMAYLRYGIQQEQGFIIVTGDVGTGKTMLVNNLFKELESKSIVAAKIVSSNVSENDLLRLIASNFGLPYERSSKAALLRHLEAYFRSCKDEGKRILLIVDEVQNLPRGSLEELRMLSNFDYQGEPLVQSFLLGQREFRTMMRAPGLEQLRQRVLAAYHLKPLSDLEVKTYIEHRLNKVGWKNDPSIDDDVFFAIYRYTRGVPRKINTLVDRVLLNCSLEETHRIALTTVETIADEMDEERQAGSEDDADYFQDKIDGTGNNEPEESRTTVSVATNAQVEASAAELRKMAARMEAMQRTIDNLSLQLEAPLDPNLRRDSLWSNSSGPRKVGILTVVISLGVVAIGMAGAVVYRLLA